MCKWVMFFHEPVFMLLFWSRWLKGKYYMNFSSSESRPWKECFSNFLNTQRGDFKGVLPPHYNRGRAASAADTYYIITHSSCGKLDSLVTEHAPIGRTETFNWTQHWHYNEIRCKVCSFCFLASLVNLRAVVCGVYESNEIIMSALVCHRWEGVERCPYDYFTATTTTKRKNVLCWYK